MKDNPNSGLSGLPVPHWQLALEFSFSRVCSRTIDRRARKKAGMTQAGFAAKLGRLQSFVAKYEGSERRLDVAEFICVA
jgi:hypothetical protein